jgi:hypothetical protein
MIVHACFLEKNMRKIMSSDRNMLFCITALTSPRSNNLTMLNRT